MSDDYLTTLAEFACTTRLADLPASLLQRGRWIIADSVGAIAGGMQTPEMQAFILDPAVGAGLGGWNCSGAQPARAAQAGARRGGGSSRRPFR